MTLGKFIKTFIAASLLTFFGLLGALWVIAYCKGYVPSSEPREPWKPDYSLEEREKAERAAWGDGPPGTWSKRK